MLARLGPRLPAVASTALPVAVAVAAGYGINRYGIRFDVAVVTGMTLVALVLRSRALILGMTTAVVVLASSNDPSLKSVAFYGRFAMFGLLTAVNLISAQRFLASPGLRRFAFSFALLVLTAGVSVGWSIDASLSIQRSLGFGLLATAILSSAFLHWSDPEVLRRDVQVVCLVLSLAMAASLLLWLSGAARADASGRLQGVFESPNTIGITGALLVPISLGIAWQQRGLRRVSWLVAALVTFSTLILSESRGGAIAALIGCVALLVAQPRVARGRLLAGVALLMLMVVPLLFWTPILGSPAARGVTGRFASTSGSGRVEAWELGLDLWRQRPATGWGFGTTEQVFGTSIRPIDQVFTGEHIHNGYLEALLEIGPGGVALLLVAAGTAVQVASSGKRNRLQGALLAAMVAGLVSQLVESGLTSGGSVFAFGFWTFAAAGICSPTRDAVTRYDE